MLYFILAEDSIQILIIQNTVRCAHAIQSSCGKLVGGQMKSLLSCLYIFGVKLGTSVLKSAVLDQIDAHGAQHRAVIKELRNYRPTTATGGPRIDWEERQRWVKTGHNKRNQEHIIIRHNYVAVGSCRHGGQGDGWARLPKW